MLPSLCRLRLSSVSASVTAALLPQSSIAFVSRSSIPTSLSRAFSAQSATAPSAAAASSSSSASASASSPPSPSPSLSSTPPASSASSQSASNSSETIVSSGGSSSSADGEMDSFPMFKWIPSKSADRPASIVIQRGARDSLNSLLFPHRPDRWFSKKTLKRALRMRSKPHWMSAAEKKNVQLPAYGPEVVRRRHEGRPIEERELRAEGPFLMRILRREERDRILQKHPRQLDSFNAGDQIIVTRYLELYKDKYERIAGTVLALHHKPTNQVSSFTIINSFDSEPYEMQIPFYSPYVKKIELIRRGERTKHRRLKRFYIRHLDPREYTVSLPELEGDDLVRQSLLPDELEKKQREIKEEEERVLAESKTNPNIEKAAQTAAAAAAKSKGKTAAAKPAKSK